jgi:hypothetical protein
MTWFVKSQFYVLTPQRKGNAKVGESREDSRRTVLSAVTAESV